MVEQMLYLVNGEAEQITGLMNERLSQCRPSNVVQPEFLTLIDDAVLMAKNLQFDLAFLKRPRS